MEIAEGIGIDLIEISRIRQSMERHGRSFLDRLFTQQEQDYCYKFQDPIPHFAGYFSAKEAVSKALGTGFGADVHWHDIEVLHDHRGKPTVAFSDSLQKKFNNPKVLLSISHEKEYATAIALWVKSSFKE